jgi:hypothetical protein
MCFNDVDSSSYVVDDTRRARREMLISIQVRACCFLLVGTCMYLRTSDSDAFWLRRADALGFDFPATFFCVHCLIFASHHHATSRCHSNRPNDPVTDRPSRPSRLDRPPPCTKQLAVPANLELRSISVERVLSLANLPARHWQTDL